MSKFQTDASRQDRHDASRGAIMVKIAVSAAVLVLLVPVVGCNHALDVYESKAPTQAVYFINTNAVSSPASNQPPSDLTLVTGVVQRVNLPFVNSPSLAGDKATCLLSVPEHSVPAHPAIRKVALHFDNHGWLQGLNAGAEVVLQFQKNGAFAGALLMGSLNGPNGNQPPFRLDAKRDSGGFPVGTYEHHGVDNTIRLEIRTNGTFLMTRSGWAKVTNSGAWSVEERNVILHPSENGVAGQIWRLQPDPNNNSRLVLGDSNDLHIDFDLENGHSQSNH